VSVGRARLCCAAAFTALLLAGCAGSGSSSKDAAGPAAARGVAPAEGAAGPASAQSKAGGLAQVDSALERILVAERQALAPDAPAAPPAAAPPPAPHGASGASSPFGPMHDCVRRCRAGETKPEVIQRPQLPRPDPAVLGGQTRGLIVVRFIVGVEGAPEPESIRVTTNTVQALTDQVLEALRATHFRPATLNGEAVRAEVEMRFEVRAVGYNTIDYTITGP